jgi:hypothetical protein
MSVYHVNQIKNKLTNEFEKLVDLTDCAGKSEVEIENFRLTRSLAAYALVLEGGLTADVAASCVVDGFDDNGIDAIYVRKTDKEAITLYLVQSKWSHDGNGTPDLGGVGKFIRGIEDLLEQKFEKFNAKVNQKRVEITAALLNPLCEVVAILAHTSNQKLGDHPQRELEEFSNKMNDTTEFLELITIGQDGFFRSLAAEGEAAKINLNIELQEWGKKEDPQFAVYGMVDAKLVASWWTEYQSRLFAKNLRGILGETTVNKEIKDTLEKNPEKFWYFNNGITIVADTIKKGIFNANNRALGLFQCEGVSIVNGAQTVTTIGRHFQKAAKEPVGALVPVRVISVEKAPDLDAEITKANNTQNRIEGRDFAAVDEEQQRIRVELSVLRVHYQLTRSEEFKPGARAFDAEEAISALACAKADPDLAIIAKREIGKFWENTRKPPYTDVIRKNVHGEYVFNVVLIQRQIQEILDSLEEHADTPRRASALVWGNKIISSIVFSKLNVVLLNGPEAEVFKTVGSKEFKELVAKVANSLAAEVENNYPGYIANTFKNITKSKEIYARVAAVL